MKRSNFRVGIGIYYHECIQCTTLLRLNERTVALNESASSVILQRENNQKYQSSECITARPMKRYVILLFRLRSIHLEWNLKQKEVDEDRKRNNESNHASQADVFSIRLDESCTFWMYVWLVGWLVGVSVRVWWLSAWNILNGMKGGMMTESVYASRSLNLQFTQCMYTIHIAYIWYVIENNDVTDELCVCASAPLKHMPCHAMLSLQTFFLC